MPLSVKLELRGLFDRGKLRAWERLVRADIRESAVRGMNAGGSEVVARLRSALEATVQVRRRSFPRTIRHKVFDRKKDELPALLVGSRAPLVAAHAFGADIPGPVLIPLLEEGKRIGRKAFGRLVDQLMREGNAEFRNVNGKVILFAEQSAANQRGLAPFRRAERLRRGGKFRKQKGRALEVPIAALVRDVNVPARFPFESITRAGADTIVRAIQKELDKNL